MLESRFMSVDRQQGNLFLACMLEGRPLLVDVDLSENHNASS